MEPAGNRGSVGLDALLDRLAGTDLIPSQEPLLEDMANRFAKLGQAGVSTVAQLRRELRNPKTLAALAEVSDVDADYLTLLRRAVNGFFPKPRALVDFDWLDERALTVLNGAGIKNTEQFNRAAANGIAQLEQDLGMKDGSLVEVAPLCDVSRVQWVSPKFAGALVAAGYRSAPALAAADPQALHEETADANGRLGFYQGTVGQRDINRVIQAARYVNWTTKD